MVQCKLFAKQKKRLTKTNKHMDTKEDSGVGWSVGSAGCHYPVQTVRAPWRPRYSQAGPPRTAQV